jgi:hypothetical protein
MLEIRFLLNSIGGGKSGCRRLFVVSLGVASLLVSVAVSATQEEFIVAGATWAFGRVQSLDLVPLVTNATETRCMFDLKPVRRRWNGRHISDGAS